MDPEPIPTARDLLTRDYLALAPSLPLLDAIARLERDRAHTAFVLDEAGAMVGLLIDKDCLRILGARAYDEAVAETVGDVIEPLKHVLAPATDVYAIAQMFAATAAGMLPVVDEGRVIGGVSQLAMLRALLHVYRRRAQAFSKIERAYDDIHERPMSIERMQQVYADWRPDQIASLRRRREE